MRCVVALLVFTMFAISAANASAATIYVNETGWWFDGENFNASDTPIQSAINNASDGDLILIEPGHYYENVDVVDKAVSLIGNGMPEEIVVEAVTSDATFYIKDTRDLSGIMNATVALKNITVVRKPGYLGIYVDDFYGYSGAWSKNVSIENVNVTSTSASGTGMKIDNSTYVKIFRAYINKSYRGIEIVDGSRDIVVEYGKIECPNAYAPNTIYVTGNSQALIRYNELRGGTLRLQYNDALVSITSNEFNNSGTDYDCLCLFASKNALISSNRFVVGSGKGIFLGSGSGGTILRNVITGNGEGEGIHVSGNGVYLDSNVVENLAKGIYLTNSQSVTLYNNTMNNNVHNFGVYDYSLLRLRTLTVYPNNLADGKPIYYYVGKKDLIVPSDASTAYCIDCVNVSAINLNLKNNFHGLFFYNCSDVVVSNVAMDDVARGIFAYDCENVSIVNTRINFTYFNGDPASGIDVQKSDNITMYNVSIFDKTDSYARCGMKVDYSKEIAVINSKVVCHARPLLGNSVFIRGQNVYFEDTIVEGGETYFDVDYYGIVDCKISGNLKLYGSYAKISNNEIETTTISGFYFDVSNNIFNGAVLITGSNNIFENNTVISSGSYALELLSCENSIANNTLRGGGTGLSLTHSATSSAEGNLIFNNTITDCDTGIKLIGVTNNTLIDNKVINYYKYGIEISASDFEDYLNYIDTSNTIGETPILYLVNESDKIYSGSYSFVGVVNCENVTLNVGSIESNYYGVVIAYTNDSDIKITEVNSSSRCGVLMDHATNNTVTVQRGRI